MSNISGNRVSCKLVMSLRLQGYNQLPSLTIIQSGIITTSNLGNCVIRCGTQASLTSRQGSRASSGRNSLAFCKILC